MNSKLVINSLNFHLRDEMQGRISSAVATLFNHDLFVSTIRFTLEGDYTRKARSIYRVSLLLELRTSEIVTCAEADDLMPAITSAIEKAEHLLLERYQLIHTGKVA